VYDEIVSDLRTAFASGASVDLDLASGERIRMRRVLDLEENGGWVGIHDPQGLGDSTTQRKIRLDQIVGITVLGD
jgi:hypothetical protein